MIDLIMAAAGSNQQLYREQKKILAQDGTNNLFGYSVAFSADGNYCAVGEVNGDNITGLSGDNSGSVYIWKKTIGVWEQQQKLFRNPGIFGESEGDLFGYSVSLSSDGTTCAIGAPGVDSSPDVDSGAVKIWVRSGSTWTEQATIIAADDDSGDQFGYCVSLSSDGNTVAIGAPYDDSGSTDTGSSYIFTRSGSSWSIQQKITTSTTADRFGMSVYLSSDGNTVAIGAPYNDASLLNAGAIYVWTRSGSVWSQQERILLPDPDAGDLVGYAVALSSDGNTLAIGSRYEKTSDNSGSNAGSLYIYTRSGSTWTLQQKIVPLDVWTSDYFGSSVSLSSDGNTCAIGAPSDAGIVPSTGTVFVYTRSGSTWTLQQKIFASDNGGQNPVSFGFIVHLSSDGSSLAIGAPYDDNPNGTDAGAVYVWTRSGSTWTQQQKLIPKLNAGDQFGYSMAISSDGNTCAIGAPYDDNISGVDDGAVYVWIRSGTTWTQQQKISLPKSITGSIIYFGYSVALSSDGNTMSIGAIGGIGTSNAETGAVYVWTRSGSTWTQQQKIIAADGTGTDRFGASVSLSSDGNTCAIGAIYDDVTYTNSGTVYVWTRSGSTWTQQQKIVSTEPNSYDFFGWDVALSSDGNTLAILSQQSAYPTVDVPGYAYIWTRSGSTWTQQQKIIPSGRTEASCDSVTLSSDGNTVAIGCARKNSAPFHTGSVYIWTRSGSTWTQQQKISSSSPVANDYFGKDVSLSSDGNMCAIGGVMNVHTFSRSGSVWTFNAKIDQVTLGQNFGQSIAISANARTIAIGAPYDNNTGGEGAGAAYVYLW